MAGVTAAGRILTVNAGSTSIKLSRLDGEATVAEYPALDAALTDSGDVEAVAHRVVHGGERSAPVVVDDALVAELQDLTELAPLHQPPALAALARCRTALPDVPHVACFDTAFHTAMPAAARTYALPARLRERVHVHGFHGLAHAWAVRRVADLHPRARRVVVAHLGGGQSLCAVLDGRSVSTTMGFTPLDGLVMASRCGSLDPGAVLWLAQHTDEDLGAVLAHESGLLGLSGTADMEELLRRVEAADEPAQLALDVYLHRLVSLLGGCVATLGGLDALAFSGGIGEYSGRIRQLIAERLGWLGVAVDAQATGEEVTARDARVRTFVVHAREDLQMADEVRALLGTG